MDGWNTIVSFLDGLFSGALAVSSRECIQLVFVRQFSWMAKGFDMFLEISLQKFLDSEARVSDHLGIFTFES